VCAQVGLIQFLQDSVVCTTIACQTSALVAHAKMTQVTLRRNENHFITWKALNHLGICTCSYNFRLHSNMSLSPPQKKKEKYGKKGRWTSGKRPLIYSCFLTHDTWCHTSGYLNKGYALFNSCPKLSKPGFDWPLLKNLLNNPLWNFSQLTCWGKSCLQPKFTKKICKTNFETFLISHFLCLWKICLTDFYFTLHEC